MLTGDDEITRLNSDMLQYNNNELGCCIKSGFACSIIREQTVLLQGCWASSPVLTDFFGRISLWLGKFLDYREE